MAPPHQESNDSHFFKMIHQKTLQDGKLEIPERFIRKYGNGMSSPALLKVPTGQVWKVGLRKRDGKVWLKNGWREFSNHYSLDQGHFLVFRYQGNCNFHVMIMDKTSTEIDYTYSSKHLRGIPDESESEDDDCIEIMEEIPAVPSTKFPCPQPRKKMTSTDSPAMHNGVPVPAMTKKPKAGEENDTSECRKRKDKTAMPCPQPHEKMKFDSPNTSGTRINLKSKASAPVAKGRGATTQKSPEVEVLKSRGLTGAEKTEALKKASGFRSKNPFFKVVMQPSCLSFEGRVSIPVRFARENIKIQKGTLILCSLNGQTWHARYNCMKKKNGFQPLLHGVNWEAFAKDNALEVGDVCAFELIEMRPQIMLKVSIYPIDASAARSNEEAEADDDVSIEILEETSPAANDIASCSSSKFPKRCSSRASEAAGSRNQSFFIKVVTPAYLDRNRCRLHIPFEFVDKHFKPDAEIVILQVAERVWSAKLVVDKVRRVVYIGAGWLKFARENCLAVGDFCIFKLIASSNGDPMLNVSISRRDD